MNATWIFGWWNLIFLLPFALALLYLGLYMASGITFGDADGDLDAGADADVHGEMHLGAESDLDHDMDAAGADAAADHDASADHDTQAESDEISHGSSALSALGWLGVGKVPASILLMVLLLTWGVVGFVTNASMLAAGASAAVISIPIAGVISLVATRIVVTLIVRYLPLNETTARRRHALLGCSGQAIFAINQRFGMVSVRDESGELFQVPCRVEAADQTIPKGATVKLVAYNAKQGLFFVTSTQTSRIGGTPQHMRPV